MIFPGSDNSRLYFVIGAAIVVALLFYVLGPILTPFLFAAILAYICDPLVDRLQRRRVPRTLATVIVLLLLISLFVSADVDHGAAVSNRSGAANQTFARLHYRDQRKVDPVDQYAKLGLNLELDFQGFKQNITEYVQGADGLAAKVFASLKIGGMALVGFFVNLIVGAGRVVLSPARLGFAGRKNRSSHSAPLA